MPINDPSMPAVDENMADRNRWVMRFRSRVSSEDELRLASQVGIAMLGLGAVSFIAVLTAPDPNTSDHGANFAFAGIMALSAALLALAGPRPNVLRFAGLWGTLVLSVFIVFAKPIGPTPFFYIWPILHSAYFFGRREVIANLVLLTVTFGAALALFQPPGIRGMVWIGTVLSLSLLAAVIRLLKGRIDRLMADLQESSRTDPLTGLLNRRAFAESFEHELARSRRSQAPLTLAIFDLDHFKQINDQLGHAAGDRALCQFADLLRAKQRYGDCIARVGGEEFAVLLIDCDTAGGKQFAIRVAESTVLGARTQGQVTVSAGLASLGGALQSQDALLLAADSALYEAKAAGRQRVAVHGAEITVARPTDTSRSAPADAMQENLAHRSVPSYSS